MGQKLAMPIIATFPWKYIAWWYRLIQHVQGHTILIE